MGVGFGLMVLIAFAGDSPSSALGVGGFLVVIGLAFFINSLFEPQRPARCRPVPDPVPSSPAARTDTAQVPRRYAVQSVLIHPVLPIM